MVKSPFGFPMSPAKWTVEFTSSDTQTQSAPTNGTWYNIEVAEATYDGSYKKTAINNNNYGNVIKFNNLITLP